MVGYRTGHLFTIDFNVGHKWYQEDRRARGSPLVQESRVTGNPAKGRETMTEDELLQQLLKATESAKFHEGRTAALDAEVDYLRGVVNTLLENLMGKK